MEAHPPKRSKPSYTRHSSGTLPANILRSQYAAANVSTAPRQISDTTGPRYFSSPYRAPLNPKERQESFIEHQRSISSAYSNDILPPQYMQSEERSSYTFFGPGPAVNSKSDATPLNKPSSSRATTANSSQPEGKIGVIRQASLGHKAKPALTTVKRTDSNRANKNVVDNQSPQMSKTTTTELRNAIASALGNSAQNTVRPPLSRNTTDVRMPFDSPSSMYSQEGFHFDGHGMASDKRCVEPQNLSPTIEERMTPTQLDADRSSPLSKPTPYSQRSASSQNPLLGLGAEQQGRDRNIPEKLRPPRLDMEAVREAEARGSITSLPDLIRRATRLAANLDRGRTASTFSMFDLFKNGERGGYGNRASTLSDMFPNHNHGSPTRAQRSTMWPQDQQKDGPVAEKQKSKPTVKSRKCCGLSAGKFVFLLAVLVVLIAAAVLLPIFLVVVPNQKQTRSIGLDNCPNSHPCANSGVSIVDNNECSCVCVDGFSGKDCSTPGGPSCITSDVETETQLYANATIGDQVGPLLTDAKPKFGIPLNSSILLSTFSNYNLSCASENSLVLFDATSRNAQKRLVMLPDLKSQAHSVPLDRLSSSPTRIALDKSTPPHLAIRQTVVRTSDNIVYQTTSGLAVVETQAASATPGNTTATTQISSSSAANLTSDQLEFAKVVVLYVLIHSRTPSIAVTAQQMMEQYFQAGGLSSGNNTVDVVNGDKGQLIANFEQLAIVLEDGQVVGGTHAG